MRFDTELRIEGPLRAPAEMLADQVTRDGTSVHDDATAAALGLTGAPIEAPTHFSQVDPLAVAAWGPAWFERGRVSAHFRTMVVEGELVRATLDQVGARSAAMWAEKEDDTQVLVGSASIGPDHPTSALDDRLAALRDPGELFLVDQVEIGATVDGGTTSVDFDTVNGPGYPFTLREKLARITEPHPWYTEEGAAASPWGRPILPMEMISVLSAKAGGHFPVRRGKGLFLDLEVRLLHGPVFVDQEYAVTREAVGVGQSRRTESFWVRTRLTDTSTGAVAAEVLLHSGIFKESAPEYPADRLG